MSAAEAGRPLIDLLAEWVPEVAGAPVSRARLRALVVAGAVRVQGLSERTPGRRLGAGTRVDAFLRVGALRAPTTRTDRRFVLGPAAILYRDPWLIAVDKPPGLPTHPTADPRRRSLVDAVRDHLASGAEPPYLAVHQRLDRDTSGVVLFATDAAANAGLARAFSGGGEAEKTYAALTAPGRSTLGTRLGIDEPLATTPTGRVRVGGAGARPARTAVVIRERFSGMWLVEARPSGGRKHQIRLHLAWAGMPVLGDPLYGTEVLAGLPRAPRLMLHAVRLELPHPVTGRRLLLESPLPADFERMVQAARRTGR